VYGNIFVIRYAFLLRKFEWSIHDHRVNIRSAVLTDPSTSNVRKKLASI